MPAALALPPSVADYLTRGESRWVLRRCARRGHILAHLDDPALVPDTGPVELAEEGAIVLRCLRCGSWVSPQDLAVREVVGSATTPAALGDLPLPVRGAHGRRIGLLRLLAVERAVRGMLLIAAGLVAYEVASARGSILSQIERLLVAARPLAEELGVDLASSPLVLEVEKLLAGSGNPVRLAGVGLLAYGLLQVVEGVGLWGGWLWAEYLAAVATSLFIPLEVYELVHKPTLLKAGALLLNIAVVIYLVYKGRLFGVRGGHAAYLAEVRDSTLPADILRSLGRPTTELASHRIV